MTEFSRFHSLASRYISLEIFFNSLLSDEDISKLLCTCRGMKEIILNWKNKIPNQQITFKKSFNDGMLYYFLENYSNIFNSIVIIKDTELTLNGLKIFCALCVNISEIKITSCKKYWLPQISLSLFSLISIVLHEGRNISSSDMDSLSKLTNLEKIDFFDLRNFDDAAVVNYSTLTKMKSITIRCPSDYFTGVGLSYLVANKEYLVTLKIQKCLGIINRVDYTEPPCTVRYSSLSLLTNLTTLDIPETALESIQFNLFLNLQSLSISSNRYSSNGMDFNAFSVLTNLENIKIKGIDHSSMFKCCKFFGSIWYCCDFFVHRNNRCKKYNCSRCEKYESPMLTNCSVLTKLNSITIINVMGLKGMKLSSFVAKREFLIQLEITRCMDISTDELCCLTTLTQLKSLTLTLIKYCNLVLNIVCSSCRLIEYLDVRYNLMEDINIIYGFDNILCLTKLKSLFLSDANDELLTLLSPTLRYIFLHRSIISKQVRSRFASTTFEFSPKEWIDTCYSTYE
jgi:hypothetical protein